MKNKNKANDIKKFVMDNIKIDTIRHSDDYLPYFYYLYPQWAPDHTKIINTLANISASYCNVSIPKKISGTRNLSVPNKFLKPLQEFVKLLITNQLKSNNFSFSPIAQGFIEGRGIYTNAHIHRNKKYILHLDLKDFFTSIHFGRVSGFFIKDKNFKLQPHIAYFFANLCCLDGVLPQGSPTSPIISNLIAQHLDKKVLLLSKKYHFTFSRYADDLVFSTNDTKIIVNELPNFLNSINSIVKNQGFEINWDKLSLMGPDVRHTVTGLSNNVRVSVTKNFYLETRAISENLYASNSFFVDNKLFLGHSDKSITENLKIVEGRFAFIYDIERRNRQFYSKKTFGKALQGKNNNNYQPNHKITFLESKNKKQGASDIGQNAFNGKIWAYSKFLFFKYFIYGDKLTIFCEGKTDPIYLKAAMGALGYNNAVTMYSIETLLNEKNVFVNLFGLPMGGSGLQKLIYYFLTPIKNSKSYYDFFEKKTLSMKPVVLLVDYELKKDKPLNNIINAICIAKKLSKNEKVKLKNEIESDLDKNGYYFLGNNVYIAVTIDFNSKKDTDRSIEEYFPTNTLLDIEGNQTRHFGNENCKVINKNKHLISNNSQPMEKIDFAIWSLNHRYNRNLFIGFINILNIFDNIRNDYLNILIDNLDQKRVNVIYNILNSQTIRNAINDPKNSSVRAAFKQKIHEVLQIEI